MSTDLKASPEIKKLIDKLTPEPTVSTAQAKYENILKRKCYNHHCFLECVLLRLDSWRSPQTQCGVQKLADETFIHMLEHVM